MSTIEARRAELQAWIDRARGFEGWSFDGLQTNVGEPQPWKYATVVADYAPGATAVLDLGTGGGEALERLLPAFPPAARVVALEQWHVNVPVAAARLRPHGVEVAWAALDLDPDLTKPITASALPFRAGAFDLVIAAHSGAGADEIARVLRPGGWFVTQQPTAPGGWRELHEHLPMTDWGDAVPGIVEGLRAQGLEIVRFEQHLNRTRYVSLGALTYLIEVTHTWECPTFSLDTHLDALLAIEAAHGDADGGVTITEGRSLIVARKP